MLISGAVLWILYRRKRYFPYIRYLCNAPLSILVYLGIMASPAPQQGLRRPSGLAQRKGLVGSAARFWHRSYAADYCGLVLLLAAYLYVVFYLEPFHRMFSLDNLAIQFPHASVERVPVPLLFAYAGGVPFATIVIWLVAVRPGWHKAHVTLLGLLISLILTSFITDVIKNAVGRPRPDLIARCKPGKGTPEHSLVTFEVCSETDPNTLHEGFRSFPSGHSSWAFSGLGYLALFLAGQLHVLRPQTDLARVLVALAPLLGAALIAISRCEDYRHDVYDVTTGSILGMSVAFLTYRRYYPPLRSTTCAVPYPSRADDFMASGGGKLKDEEARVQSAAGVELDDVGDDLEVVPLRHARGSSDSA